MVCEINDISAEGGRVSYEMCLVTHLLNLKWFLTSMTYSNKEFYNFILKLKVEKGDLIGQILRTYYKMNEPLCLRGSRGWSIPTGSSSDACLALLRPRPQAVDAATQNLSM
jgi:hypothetical protein